MIFDFVFIKKPIVVFIVYIVLAILVGFTVNKFYIFSARRKIRKINKLIIKGFLYFEIILTK